MRTGSIAAVGIAVVLATSGTTAHLSVVEPQGRLSPRSQSSIVGTLYVRGCQLAPEELQVRASSISLVGPDLNPPARPDSLYEVRAPVAATSNPHAFRFQITGLPRDAIFHLSVVHPPNPICGKLFWRGPFGSLALSGGPAISIEGVAATTEVEVLEDGTRLAEWVGADYLDFTDAARGSRQLRWRTTLPGVVAGELQISTTKFPNQGVFRPCDEPSLGIVHRQQVPVEPGQWGVLPPVAFDQILSPQTRALPPSVRGRLLLGAPVYVRVVPLLASGPACNADEDGVPGWVILAKLPVNAPDLQIPDDPPLLDAGDGHVYAPPYLGFRDAGGHPAYGEVAYRIIKPHKFPTVLECKLTGVKIDPFGCILVLNQQIGEGIQAVPGQWFYYKLSSSGGGSSWTDVFSDFVTGFVQAIGVLVNTVSDFWNDAIDAAKGLAHQALLAIPLVSQFCSDKPQVCEKGIDAGVTIALASVGLPPTAPNWDQLKQQGLDYVATMVAEKIEEEYGFPASISEQGLKQLSHAIVSQLDAQRKGAFDDPAYDWVQPYVGFNPAVWLVTVRKNGPDPLPPNIQLHLKQSPLFLGTNVPLPRKFLPLPAGTTSVSMTVPMPLYPNMAGIPAPLCSNDRSGQIGCVPNVFLGIEGQPTCRYESWKGGNNFVWTEFPCDGTNWIDLYYRDKWTNERFDVTTCTTLSAAALQDVNGLFFVYPGVSFPVFGILPPALPVSWSGPAVSICQPAPTQVAAR